eukprot:CAMPEP_0197440536 /NCGR_PEP_ID=MMETSP1175-20131217/7016_1 /TAXON_ID=1003142 /ORGANISM="Triceratium dubium, Strain CCMP147" /LENGTH=268 /DNA_ID=CAMNT_0042970667 /DNA_START=451 /DNA_END=1257 /DNA_ORIENTATION=-
MNGQNGRDRIKGLRGMKVDDGRALMVSTLGGLLYRIDLTTKTVTYVNDFKRQLFDFAFSYANNTFTVSSNDAQGNSFFQELNLGSDDYFLTLANPRINSGVMFLGLVSVLDTFYGSPVPVAENTCGTEFPELYQIDMASGTKALLGQVTGSFQRGTFVGMTYDETTDSLYGMTGCDNGNVDTPSLVEIDRLHLNASLICSFTTQYQSLALGPGGIFYAGVGNLHYPDNLNAYSQIDLIDPSDCSVTPWLQNFFNEGDITGLMVADVSR